MEAVVTFEYEAQQDDELNLKIGDVITNVQSVDEGWCEGVLNGKKGMFPDNFVKLREPPPISESNGMGPAQIRGMSQMQKIRRAKVTFSYAADNIDELSLEPGQVVEVLAEEEEGWWRGKMGGKEGVFPSNFVEIIEEANEQMKPPAPAVPSETAPEPQVHKHKMGQPVMPKFDPSQALAKLKKSNVEPKKPAPAPAPAVPPLTAVSKPPLTKAPPPDISSSKPVEKAKVTFDYEADNEDELTIKIGEIVEIVNKNTDNDGWWEVRLRDRVGLIPDNFVEILPASPPPIRRPSASARTIQPPPQEQKTAPLIPSKPPGPGALRKKPPAPDPGKKPPKLEPQPPPVPPPASTTNAVTPDKETQDFGVPSTQPLDSSAVKSRPKKSARPPSRSNLLQHMEEENMNQDGEVTAPPLEKPSPAPAPGPAADKPVTAPWQRELLEKKKKAPLPKPVPGLKSAHPPKPAAPSKLPTSTTPAKPAVSKPEPPKVHVEPKPSPAPAASKEPLPSSLKQSDTPSIAASASTVTTVSAPPTSVPNNEWKDAFENLKEEFEKFKKFVLKEIQTLTDDLDKEIKHRAALEVDIERLKKSRGFPH